MSGLQPVLSFCHFLNRFFCSMSFSDLSKVQLLFPVSGCFLLICLTPGNSLFLFTAKIFFPESIPAHLLDSLVPCFIFMLLHGHHLLIYGNFPLFFFATSTIRPFFWEYSQVDSVSNLSLYFAVVPV